MHQQFLWCETVSEENPGKVTVCRNLLPLSSCGMAPGSGVGSRARHDADAFRSDVGHSHCCRGSNVLGQHTDGAWDSGGRTRCGHVAAFSVLVFFSALHLNMWSCSISGPHSCLYTLIQLNEQKKWDWTSRLEVTRVWSTTGFKLISISSCSFYCWREGARAGRWFLLVVVAVPQLEKQIWLILFVYFALTSTRPSLTQVN